MTINGNDLRQRTHHIPRKTFKNNNNINLELIPILYPNIDKWIADDKIDNELSNKIWTNKNITNSQKTCLLKLKHGQYMENARKQLFFSREAFPSITCPICNSPDPDTLATCTSKVQTTPHHALRTKRHNSNMGIKKTYSVIKNVKTLYSHGCGHLQ